MSLPAIRRIYEITVDDQSIVFYSRFLTEVGRDIAAVKYALGDVYAADINNRSPEDDSFIGRQWFTCDGDGVPLTPTALATFDKRLQKSLMSFQLKHQFLILNYYWDRGGLAGGINTLTNLPQALEQMIYKFDADFGTISEATIAILHGWRPGSDAKNLSFVTSEDTAVEQIPSFMYDMYTNGTIAVDPENIKDIYDFDRSKDNDNNIETRFNQTAAEYRKWLDRVIESARESSSNALGALEDLNALMDQDVASLNDSERYVEYYASSVDGSNSESVLYNATREALSILEEITPEDMSPQQRERLIAAAVEPDHLSQVVPFLITNFKSGFFDRTNFSFENLPPFDGISDDKKLELQELALPKVLEFYGKEAPNPVPDEIIKFVDLRAPSLRPGDVYRAFFHLNTRIIDSLPAKAQIESQNIEQQTVNLQDSSITRQQQLDDLIGEIESEFCVGGKSLNDEDTRIQYEKYRSFASKKKLEISRTIAQQVIRGRDPTQNVDGIDLDLGVFGKAHLSQQEINSVISDGALFLTGLIGDGARALAGATTETGLNPDTLIITYGDLQEKVYKVADAFDELKPDLDNYDIKSEQPFYIDQEIRRLRDFIPSFSGHVAIKTSPRIELKDQDQITIKFEDYEAPNTPAGSTIKAILVNDKPVPTPTQESVLLTSRTINFVRNIEDLYPDTIWVLDAFNGGSCDKPGPKKGVGASYILRHVKNASEGGSKTSNWRFLHEWGSSVGENVEDTLGVEFSLTEVDTTPGGFSQGIELTRIGADAPRGSSPPMFGFEKLLPVLGEDCTDEKHRRKVEKMLKKTLDTKRLLCEYIACLRLQGVQAQVPNIPKFRWPKLPQLFDDSWSNLAKDAKRVGSIIACMFLKGILDILQSPMCEERFVEGIFGAASNQSPEVQRALASGFLDTGIPPEKQNNAKDLIDALMKMLSPRELCALLNGEPVNDEVYQIVRTVAESLGLGAELNTRDQISNFFIPIGLFVGPALCEELSRYDLREDTCEDIYTLAGQIRNAAAKGEALTQEQIDAAVSHAENQLQGKADALDFLMNGGSLQDLLPDFSSLENNPAFSKPPPLTEKTAMIAAKATLGMAEMAFIGSLNSYVESFFQQTARFARPGDQEYDEAANMKIQRALCNLQRFSKQDLNFSDFASLETTTRLRRILYILCDDYEKTASESGSLTYDVDPQIEQNLGQENILRGSLLDKYNVRNAIRDSEDNARILFQTQDLSDIWSLMFPISAGDLDERTRTISTLADWSKPIFRGVDLNQGDMSTLNSSYMNKINQILTTLQQEITSNLEKAFVTKNESDFLPGLREFYDSDKPLSQQDGSSEDLLTVKIRNNLETELRHPDIQLRNEIKVVVKEDFYPNAESDVARTKVKITDPFFLGTDAATNEYSVQYCEKIPEQLRDPDTSILPRPAAYKKIITDILKSNFAKYKVDNINIENYFSNTNPQFIDDLTGQSFLDAYEGIYEQIASSVRGSRIFQDAAYRDRLDLKLRSKFYFDPATQCFKNPNSNPKYGVLNFEKLITEEFPEQYMREFASPSNSPITEDFSTPGAFENAMMNTSMIGFIRMCLIELLMKGAVTLSVWDIDFVKGNKIYRDYLVEFVTRQIEDQQFFTKNKKFTDQTIQRLSATNNIKVGLRNIILREIDGVVSSLSKEIFENDPNYGFSKWFLDTIPFVPIANTRASNGETWISNLDHNYLDSLKYNNFMYLEDYVRVNGSIRSFRSSRSQIAQAQFDMLESQMAELREINRNSNIPNVPSSVMDHTDYDISNPNSVSLEGAFDDTDAYADTELMSVKEFSSLIQSMVDNNSELSKYFHAISGKVYDPGERTHGMPKTLTQNGTPSRIIKRTRQHIKFDNVNIFSLLLKKSEGNANAVGEMAIDKFMSHHYNICKQTKHAFLFNVLTTGDYGEERYSNYTEGNASSLIRRAFKSATMEEDRYYVITDQLDAALRQAETYSQDTDSDFSNSDVYDKYEFKVHEGPSYHRQREEIKLSPYSDDLTNINNKAANFKSSAGDPALPESANPRRITINPSSSDAEIIFSTPSSKCTKEEHDLLLEENPSFENEIWEETVIDLVGDAAPIFQFPGDSGWIPREHMSDDQKRTVAQKLKECHYWLERGDSDARNIAGIFKKLYALDENSPEVTDPTQAHMTEIFAWNPGSYNIGDHNYEEKEKAFPIKAFGSAYGSKWNALGSFHKIWDDNSRTYYRNDLTFKKSAEFGDYRIDYDTEQLTPNEYKIPLRILITQVKNKNGDILKVFVRYVLPQFLSFEDESLNDFRAQKMTEACVDTLDGWGRFVIDSFRKIMLDWYQSGNGQWDEYKILFSSEEENPDPLTAPIFYDNRVLKVLRQGKDVSAHPLIPFIKGTQYSSDARENETDNSWWGSRFASWVSTNKLYSHACRIEAENKEGNFGDTRSDLDRMFANPGNLLRRPGNSSITTNPVQEYQRFKNQLMDSAAGSGRPNDSEYTNPRVMNAGHSHNFDQFVREMFMNYNLSKHRLYEDGLHDTLQAYTGISKDDSRLTQSPGTTTLQTIGNLVSWFSQKRVDSFWGKTSKPENRKRLFQFNNTEIRDAWKDGVNEETLWQTTEVENIRCGPSLFYNDMRTPIHTLIYNMLRLSNSSVPKMEFVMNIQNSVFHSFQMPEDTKDAWNWLLKEGTQLNAYTHFYPGTNGDQHFDNNLAQVMNIFKREGRQVGIVDPGHDGANFYMQTQNEDRDPSDPDNQYYFYWNLTEEQAKSMNMYMHYTEVPSNIHGVITAENAKATIDAALENELLAYKKHIIGVVSETPKVVSGILSRWDAALTQIGLTRIIREVTTGYTSLLSGQDQTLISDILQDSRMSYGIRASMYNTSTPGDRRGSTAVIKSSVNDALLDLWTNHSNASEEERCGNLKTINEESEELDMYSIPIASHEVLIADIDCYQATNLTSLERKIQEIQQEVKAGLLQEQDFKNFFEFAVPYKNMATLLTIHGTTLLAGFGDMPGFLASTKNGLAAAFDASTLVDPQAEDLFGQYPSAADVAISFGSTGPAGGESIECFDAPNIGEWAKMIAEMIRQFIKYFPSVVLRGISDQIDPMYKEMKRHYMNCELPDLRNGSWSAYGGRKSKTELGMYTGEEFEDNAYLPLIPNVAVDMFMGVNDILKLPSDPTRFVMTLDRFIAYIIGGPKPLLDGQFAFRLPCAKINAESPPDWSRYRVGDSGRYGHPITPLNLLALQTLELPRDRELRKSICQNREIADPKICDDEE
tara:strand:+ start:7798 stop:17529 length:9732 start_codon:yes stop_codon:yes gene_type:complete